MVEAGEKDSIVHVIPANFFRVKLVRFSSRYDKDF